MANQSLAQRLFALSPHVEMIGRRLYWTGITNSPLPLSRRKKARRPSNKDSIDASFSEITRCIEAASLAADEVLLVHSAFGPLKKFGKSPAEINCALRKLVGPQGTLAMPAMPRFENAPSRTEYLNPKAHDRVFEYDPNKTPISTGLLPAALHSLPESRRSLHPVNSMVAVGPQSDHLMAGNLSGQSPLACGINSSWKKCADANALVVGLGVDLTHSLTMIHVAEDVMDESWPVKDWYHEKRFLIRTAESSREYVLRERRPNWGALHFGERTLCRDLTAEGILKTQIVQGVLVEYLRAAELMEFLMRRNANGYPYFWVRRK